MKKKNTLLLGLTCLFATASISAITVNVTNKTAKTISLQNAVTVYRTKTPEFRNVDSIKPQESKQIAFSSTANNHPVSYRFVDIPMKQIYNNYYYGFDASYVKGDITFE
ncbi:hypothetical protein [Candidatus Chromulinivorax destructor]|uniref:Uncharacterized protein n=1 Tax=Candidatus Chromulinivorax destructor TaxID=2066483 RepID=A0A345ZA18_9BACT|nr:hypothetical protein [Candidatus Chromulinivorax destructor]AXK60135.1 hypothetical protein C0J27_00015 [Candidatus Chromulinivorax destructor]